MVSLHKESGAMIKAIEKNLNDLTDCVKNLKALHDETGLPVDDDNETFHRLCEKLEFLLCVGLEGSSRMFRHPRTTWHYINACLRSSGRTSDGIRIVRGLSELKTPLGKLRSFLRYCLVHQCLADTMQQCTLCGDITNDYYGSNALMANTNLRSNFIASLYELNDIQFDLAPTGYDLDVGWPTFARKQFGNFSWTKQLHSSRLSNSSFLSTSVQSLTSLQSGMTSPPSPGPLNSTMVSSVSVSPPGDSLETERLIRLVRQLTEEKDEMRDQLKAANKQLDEEKENSTKDRQRMEEEILQYKAQIEDLERRLESAEKQVQESDHASLEKERQLAAVKQELQAFRFDQATRELQQEREKEAYKQQQEQLSSALDRLRDNEMLIRSLQEQLNALTGKNHEERQALDAQLRQLELSLMTRNEECEGLVNELRSTVAEMDQLRTAHLALQETVKTVRAAESQLKTDNQLLRDESLMLRDKIVQLIKEKDCLWQRSDRLLDLQRVQATHQWLSDDSISSCQACNTRFTLFVRRHHCRLCGRIFCHGCSDYWLRIASSARPTRTCPECYAIHQQFSQPGAGQLNGLGTMTDQQEVTVTADPVVAQHQPETSEPCAGFSVISDDEIVRSLNSSSPYSSPKDNHVEKTIRTATVKSFKSLLEQKSDERNMLEAFVSAGMVYRVPLQVDKPGYTLHWKFKTDPQSIAFAVVGFDGNETEANNEEEHDASSRVIVETALHKSERGFVEGHANLVLPGRYFVYFDNSFSRFAAKKVTFHLSLTSSIL